MTDDTEDSDAALRRLEAALDRIARHAAGHAPRGDAPRSAGPAPGTEVTEGLDRLIERLRATLARR